MTDNQRDILPMALEQMESKAGLVWGPEWMEEVAAALRALLDEVADLKARIDTAWADNSANDRITDRLRAELAALKAHDPQTDAQVQEQVAAIVHAAMRFDREDVTPEWQAGNSHAEYRARQAATEIAWILRCALKSQADPLAEMWRELAEYQPQADKDGHGESWRVMCEQRTVEAASAASWAALESAAGAASWAASASARAAGARAAAAQSIAALKAKEAQR